MFDMRNSNSVIAGCHFPLGSDPGSDPGQTEFGV